jgi:5-oxoprolinase (ATP-hydrolysing)
MLGKLQPDYFPAVFGPQADQPLDADAVAAKFAELTAATGMPAEEIAAGFLRIAVDNMANAIKKISIQRGFDVSNYVLGCFGGAGGQHACLVADSLSIKKIFIHPFAGVLSAFGMGLADTTAQRILAVEATLDESLVSSLVESLDRLQQEAEAELLDQDIAPSRIESLRRVHLKYVGSDTAIIVPFASAEEIIFRFDEAHRAQYGFVDEDRAHVVEAVEVESIGAGEAVEDRSMDEAGGGRTLETMPLLTTCTSYMEGEFRQTAVVDRNAMLPGDTLDGPVVIQEDTATTCVEPGWQAELTGKGDLVLTRVVAATARVAAGTTVDPVMLEIFNNLFMSIAEQMGLVLRQTSYSVNIKERLDFSCAVFGQEGELIANAPHMPVHLGSMDESIKAVIRSHTGTMRPGDVYVLNAPYNGGTHLPDITVISPVFDEQGVVLFYVASRGHHADIGGITPGSMPPFSRHVSEEGVLLDNIKIVDGGVFLEETIRELLSSGQYPARNVDANIADLKAQLAANEKGVQELRRIVAYFGLEVTQAYMKHVQDNAEESVRRVLADLSSGHFVRTHEPPAEITSVSAAACQLIDWLTDCHCHWPGVRNGRWV